MHQDIRFPVIGAQMYFLECRLSDGLMPGRCASAYRLKGLGPWQRVDEPPLGPPFRAGIGMLE